MRDKTSFGVGVDTGVQAMMVLSLALKLSHAEIASSWAVAMENAVVPGLVSGWFSFLGDNEFTDEYKYHNAYQKSITMDETK